ncbi:MAG: hypothetical protein ACKERG_03425 [Candidatus Hodgkinia cicadicola]
MWWSVCVALEDDGMEVRRGGQRKGALAVRLIYWLMQDWLLRREGTELVKTCSAMVSFKQVSNQFTVCSGASVRQHNGQGVTACRRFRRSCGLRAEKPAWHASYWILSASS